MLTPSQSIVCFGRDFTLLNTRRQILEQASYPCLATSDPMTVTKWMVGGRVGILVLCHTLTTQDLEAIIRYHREMHCTASILRLRTNPWSVAIGPGGLVCEAQTAPASFLAAVSQISTRPGLSA